MSSGISCLTSLDLSSVSFASVNMVLNTNFSLKITVKDQVAYNFIYSRISAAQKPLLTIKS